jgi:nucleotide-binding universal stress UspA family protein
MAERAIVVGTDGSPTAERAVQRAGELGSALGASVHVVMSCRPPSAFWMAAAGGVAIPDAAAETEVRGQAAEVVERARTGLARHGVPVHTHVCEGDPADALTTIADAHSADIIVVGNRGMSGARRVLGSVPNRVSHTSRCAVLIVPTG